MTTQTRTRLVPAGQPDDEGRQKYKPVVAEVTGFSQYNADQFSLSGIDGFWSLSRSVAAKMSVPQKGTRALWTLATKPKTGPKAKPGSVYMDVDAVAKVPQDYAENDVEDLPWDADAERDEPAPERAPAPRSSTKPSPDAIRESDPLPAEWTLPLSEYRRKNESIQAQTVYNGIVEILKGEISPHLDADDIERLKANLFGLIERLAPGLPITWAGVDSEPVSGEDVDSEPEKGNA